MPQSDSESRSILDVDPDELIDELTAGVGEPLKLQTSVMVQIGIWAELQAIRIALESMTHKVFV